MGHAINAFVAKRPAISAVSRALDGAPFYRLLHPEFLVLPVGFEAVDALEARRGPSEPVVEDFWQLTGNLAAVGRECSVHGAVAYIATDYFGGHGTQAAAAWEDVRLVREPEVGGIGRINSALRWIGLVAKEGLDAFDTLGLGDMRSMSDFANLTPQQ
jgi:hypothetical protein